MPELDIREWVKRRTIHLLRGRQQKILGDALGGEGGVSRFLNEQALPNPELQTIEKIAKALGVSVAVFFGAATADPQSELVEDLKYILTKTNDHETLLPIKFVIERTARDVSEIERRKSRKKGPARAKEKTVSPKSASG